MLHACRQGQRAQVVAVIESIAANIDQSFWQFQLVQILTETECEVINIGQFRVTKIYIGQFFHILSYVEQISGCVKTKKGDEFTVYSS